MLTILSVDQKVSKKGTTYNLLTVKAKDGSVGRIFDFTDQIRVVGDLVEVQVTFDRNLNPRIKVV